MAERGSCVSDADIARVRAALTALEKSEQDPFIRGLRVIGYLTWLLEKAGTRPIVVGGKAVELYTSGHYTTADVDFVLDGRELAGRLLEQVGFEARRTGERHWYHPRLQLPVEIPDNVLQGSEEKVLSVDVGDGCRVYVIGVEDLVLDRLRAAVYWNSRSDEAWALLLLCAMWDDIDLPYLLRTAAQERPELAQRLDLVLQRAQAMVDADGDNAPRRDAP
ncbi:MAG: UbiD family decarboxylase [Thermoflavifilum sp.]|nr:UbiD family decarboxylase [Thermoflavifilum sp.]MCL6515073.1 nucleotidyltransferase [Alicyclobacillus sp.]